MSLEHSLVRQGALVPIPEGNKSQCVGQHFNGTQQIAGDKVTAACHRHDQDNTGHAKCTHYTVLLRENTFLLPQMAHAGTRCVSSKEAP